MFCSPLWLRKGSEKFLKCVWWGRRDVTRINSKLEKAGKTSQLQRETEPSALQRFGASFLSRLCFLKHNTVRKAGERDLERVRQRRG